jgi:uncharacterized protein YacL
MGLRIFGLVFSGIFAVSTTLIAYALTGPYLKWFRENGGLPDQKLFAPLSQALFVMLGLIAGFMIGSLLFHRMADIARNLKRIPPEDKIAGTLGTLVSLVPAFMLGASMQVWNAKWWALTPPVLFALILVLSVLILWLGNAIALSMKDEMKFFIPAANRTAASASSTPTGATPKLLDTNVIIDGRIYDICRSGFLDGPIILPGFVLEELHHIADSADSLRRNRGRRGLDILHQMQTELDSVLRLVDRYKITFAPSDQVDVKLVKLAKAMNADIVTNDFNLNKVAKLQGVRVLNINELANAVKPVVLPGEELTVTLVREGKEYNQGVGYLDDGTMVVVENGKKMIGDTVAVTVSSVLQTVAGKMIFAELRYDGPGEDSDENGSYSPSRGNRRKAY